MTDARPWEELVELVPELRPVLVGVNNKREYRLYLGTNSWWWKLEDGGVGGKENPSIAHALIRDRAAEWIQKADQVNVVWLSMDDDPDEKPCWYCPQYPNLIPDDCDYDTALRLAVAAVAGRE